MSGEVIGIVSFKGGVGKTVTAINLGAALVKKGKKVLLIDGNFLSPSMHIYLGLLKPETTLKEVIRNNLDFRNAVYEHVSGVYLMPCKFYKGIDFDKFHRLVKEMKNHYDYILVDSGPSYTEEIIAILMVCNKIFFVTTPDYPTIATTVRASKFVKYKNVEIGGVIVNRIRRKGFELSLNDIEKTLEMGVAATVLEDNKLILATSKFMPVVYYKPRAKSSKAFIKLAEKIINQS